MTDKRTQAVECSEGRLCGPKKGRCFCPQSRSPPGAQVPDHRGRPRGPGVEAVAVSDLREQRSQCLLIN